MTITAAIRRDVRDRAANRCEYCHLAQHSFPLVTFHVEHVVAKQHGGSDMASNLCLAYHWCNLFKGPNLSSLAGGVLTRLFNPRSDEWRQHFRLADRIIEGLTPIGNETVSLFIFLPPSSYQKTSRVGSQSGQEPCLGRKMEAGKLV